jgi:putative thioredoxin
VGAVVRSVPDARPDPRKVVDETNGQVVLVKVNVDENPGISQAFRVQSIPAVYALKDGQVVDGFMGALPEHEVRSFVERLLPTRPRRWWRR